MLCSLLTILCDCTGNTNIDDKDAICDNTNASQDQDAIYSSVVDKPDHSKEVVKKTAKTKVEFKAEAVTESKEITKEVDKAPSEMSRL